MSILWRGIQEDLLDAKKFAPRPRSFPRRASPPGQWKEAIKDGGTGGNQDRDHGDEFHQTLMIISLKSIFALGKQAVSEWIEEDVSRLGAALAFYTLFAIAPLFVIVLAVAGLWFGEEAARRELFGQVSGLVGSEGGEAVQALVSAANKPKTGTFATVVAAVTLFVGATGVFVQLQDALNTVWGVRRIPGRGLRRFIKDRLLSFTLLIGIGFLLLVSLVVSAGLSALGKFMAGLLPAQETIWQGLNFAVSFGIIMLLFAMIFKVLPDVKIAWRDVWIGAGITALLFNLGKFLFGLYLGRSSIASAYGAAGSLVVVLLWVYYSAQILFFGAKFTQVYSNKHGSHLEPVPGAKVVTTKESPSKASRKTERNGKATRHRLSA